MKINSIRTKLLLVLLPFIFISFVILAGTGYYFARNALSQSVDAEATAISSDFAHRIAGHINGARLQLVSFAGIKRIYNPVDTQALREALAECTKQLELLENITYIAPNGAALRPDGSMINLADREYFKKVLATQKSVISEVQVSRTTGKAGINIAVPITFEGRLTGVLTGSVSMEKLREVVKAAKFQKTGYAVVLDSKGLVIAHPTLIEVEGKLNLGEKMTNPELKLERRELDDRLVSLVEESAATGKSVRWKISVYGCQRSYRNSRSD